MSEMVMANIRVPLQLESSIKRALSKNYLSVGEFVRSAAIHLLMRLNLLSQSTVVDLLSEMSKTKSEPFDEEKELAELRKLREQIWKEKYGKRSS